MKKFNENRWDGHENLDLYTNTKLLPFTVKEYTYLAEAQMARIKVYEDLPRDEFEFPVEPVECREINDEEVDNMFFSAAINNDTRKSRRASRRERTAAAKHRLGKAARHMREDISAYFVGEDGVTHWLFDREETRRMSREEFEDYRNNIPWERVKAVNSENCGYSRYNKRPAVSLIEEDGEVDYLIDIDEESKNPAEATPEEPKKEEAKNPEEPNKYMELLNDVGYFPSPELIIQFLEEHGLYNEFVQWTKRRED